MSRLGNYGASPLGNRRASTLKSTIGSKDYCLNYSEDLIPLEFILTFTRYRIPTIGARQKIEDITASTQLTLQGLRSILAETFTFIIADSRPIQDQWIKQTGFSGVSYSDEWDDHPGWQVHNPAGDDHDGFGAADNPPPTFGWSNELPIVGSSDSVYEDFRGIALIDVDSTANKALFGTAILPSQLTYPWSEVNYGAGEEAQLAWVGNLTFQNV